MSEHEAPDGYEGEVTVTVDGTAPRTSVSVTTPHGTGQAEATETTRGATPG